MAHDHIDFLVAWVAVERLGVEGRPVVYASVVLAALRIAANLMRPGLLENVSHDLVIHEEDSGGAEDILAAAAIRKALMESSDG